MPTYFARKAGNINATDVWATTPSGVAAAVTFANGDVLVANSFAIAVNVDTNLGASGQVRNDTTGGATAGGAFTLTGGITLTASIYNGSINATCVTCSAASPNITTIVADVIRSASPNGNAYAVSNIGNGTLNITVSNEISGGTGGSGVSRAAGVNSGNGGIVNITGNVRGGSHASAPGAQANGGTLNITGIVTGATGPGVANMLTGTCTIFGSAKGVIGAGAINESTGTLYATRAIGSDYGPGNTSVASSVAGIVNSGLGVVEIQQLEFGAYGQSPVSGTGIRLKKANTNVAVFNYCDTAGSKTLIDATANAAMPAATDVRSGVSYASGALIGSCSVPAAGSTALGVPVDAGFGTAVLTPDAVWGAATRTLTAGGGISASDVWAYNSRTLTTSSGPTAVEIRQEMDANSTKLDASVSSRLASASYTAPTTPPTAAEIATAVEGSLLNEADGQAVLNAIVGAIGNTNVSEVSLVAAIRSDIERTGGKLDSVPTAAANASAVWGTATKTITGGVVDTLTNSPSVPSAASIAAATRTELAVELARVDASVSSRMAGSESTKLDAVKAKTDALNTERLANVATTAIVGNLIAQSQS